MYNVDILDEMLGEILIDIKNNGDELIFTTAKNKKYMMYHSQDCCESVTVEDIVGDLNDLIGEPLIEAEGVSFQDPKELPEKEVMWMTLSGTDLSGGNGSNTWTFYKFRTVKGSVTIRWLGSSNGYYSESVDLVDITGNNYDKYH